MSIDDTIFLVLIDLFFFDCMLVRVAKKPGI